MRFTPWVVLVLLAACEPHASSTSKPPAPAKLERPSKETELATVLLTPEAEKRLAIVEHLGKVEKRTFRSVRTLPAEVVARPGATSLVVAPFAGTIAAASSEGLPLPGTSVKKGAVVARLAPIFGPAERLNFAAQSADAEGAVARARVLLDAAKVNHARVEKLFLEKAVPQRALDESRANLDTQQATLDAAIARRDALAQATASVARAGSNTHLARLRVNDRDVDAIDLVAPEDGTVRELRASSGENVAAGATIVDVVSLSPVLVRVAVPSNELETIDRALPARIEPLAGRSSKRTREATPARVSPPQASLAPGCTSVFYELANDDALFLPGERVCAVLARRSEEAALTVPWGAVLQDALGGTWVYERTAPGTFIRRRVLVARVEEKDAVLAAGNVAVGASVVTEGASELFGTEFGVGK